MTETRPSIVDRGRTDDRIYVGTNDHADAQVAVYERGEYVGPLRHYLRHSPSGFSWGYPGSGPAELARCLLIDALGDTAWCQTCRGEALRATCATCMGEGTCDEIARCYQDFKAEVVAAWPQDSDWSYPRRGVLAWLEARR